MSGKLDHGQFCSAPLKFSPRIEEGLSLQRVLQQDEQTERLVFRRSVHLPCWLERPRRFRRSGRLRGCLRGSPRPFRLTHLLHRLFRLHAHRRRQASQIERAYPTPAKTDRHQKTQANEVRKHLSSSLDSDRRIQIFSLIFPCSAISSEKPLV